MSVEYSAPVETPESRAQGGPARRVRVDRARPAGATGRGALLGTFRVGAKEVPIPERRAEPRHQHLECLAWVGWRSWRGFHMNDAVLVNLSRGGARVFLDVRPPVGRDVWVYLETPGRKAVVKARVVGWEAAPGGQGSARVAFDELCPYALFEAAVCALHSTDPKTRAPRRPDAVAH